MNKSIIQSERVEGVILSFKEVLKIRSRGINSEIYLDMYIKLEANMSIAQCHSLVRKIEEKVRKEVDSNIQMIVHIEPLYNNETSTCRNEFV